MKPADRPASVQNVPRATAARLLLLFAFLLLGVAGAAIYQASRRADYEFTAYPSALGDEDFVPVESMPAGTVIDAVFADGTTAALTVLPVEPTPFPDDRLESVGQQTGGKFRLYQPRRTPTEGLYFAKIAPGRYLSLTK